MLKCVDSSIMQGTLNLACDIGREEAWQYVYQGNVPMEEGENTSCRHCGHPLFAWPMYGYFSLTIIGIFITIDHEKKISYPLKPSTQDTGQRRG